MIRRGDDPHIGAHLLAAADAVEHAFLEEAEQFGLEVDGEVADFVEEQAAALGHFEPPEAALERAGERAAFMTEQFGFHQFARHGCAVDGDERAGGARALAMDAAGDQALADAALAEQEHG
ncbi:MAG: hypothetical protein BWZ08_02665 [candidate division BRC1 bacterium ADurb.BinA292]|nr:MAG: hypothetical protein BWZ08_02665 [candidate division BRC1 bacterium ADurb.BinA292]